MLFDLVRKSRMTAEIRPGIHRPDWSVVTRPGAREAILGRDRSRFGIVEKWNQPLEPAQDRVWRTVLELFARSARPPHLHEIAKETGFSAENIRTLVSELRAHDLLGSDASADAILYAYPFTGEQTEHRVQLCGRWLYAVCAVDALGIGGMFRADVVIESSCRACGSRIEIGTAQGGKSLSHACPGDAVVWYDLAYSGRAAATAKRQDRLPPPCFTLACEANTSQRFCRAFQNTQLWDSNRESGRYREVPASERLALTCARRDGKPDLLAKGEFE